MTNLFQRVAELLGKDFESSPVGQVRHSQLDAEHVIVRQQTATYVLVNLGANGVAVNSKPDTPTLHAFACGKYDKMAVQVNGECAVAYVCTAEVDTVETGSEVLPLLRPLFKASGRGLLRLKVHEVTGNHRVQASIGDFESDATHSGNTSDVLYDLDENRDVSIRIVNASNQQLDNQVAFVSYAHWKLQ